MPRNRTRAERAAAGIVDLGVSVPRELRDALDEVAAARGVSRAALVIEWANSLINKPVRKKRQAVAK